MSKRQYAARPHQRGKSASEVKAQQLKLIHVGKAQLTQAGILTEDGYRDLLQSIGGVASSADMTNGQREQVIAHLKRAGFTPTRPGAGAKPDRKQDDSPQSKKLRACWIEMHEMGFVRNPAEAAMAAYIRRQTGIDALQWLDNAQFEIAIESLKKWRHRAENKLATDTGKTIPELADLARELFGAERLTFDACTKLTNHFRGA
jgi:phage gp16-like protein